VKRTLQALLSTVMVLATMTFAVAPTSAATGGAPAAGEVGITKDTIRVAVVADVDTPLSPGVFKGQVDGMKAYAKYANAHGGIAGRKLVVDFIDSQLNPDETRNATIKACSDDFAMVGTAAVFLNNVDDMVGCRDAAGAATGLPDINTFSGQIAQQCSPVSYSVSPGELDCSTKDASTKTYHVSFGQIRYYRSKYKGLHGSCIVPSDLKAAETTGRGQCAAVKKLGVKLDGPGVYDVSATVPQSGLTPIISAVKADGSTYLSTLTSAAQAISVRKEAKLQGLNTVKVWDCSRSCYTDEFLAGGADVEREYAYLNTLPLNEAKSNKALKSYLKYVGKRNANAFGETAWAAAMLFRETIDTIVARDGVNGITRAKFLAELAKTRAFDAGGMLASTDVGKRFPSDCYLLVQVQDNKFVRANPKQPGTFACNPKNVATVRLEG
jgi:ABC-type branched-subunit amino acid transport system substrate-binding protein